MISIGLDLLHVPRFSRVLGRYGSRLRSRIQSPCEHHPDSDMAKVWALKEATYKCLSARQKLQWKDIVVQLEKHRAPAVHVPGFTLNATLSHDGDYLVAMVMAQDAKH